MPLEYVDDGMLFVHGGPLELGNQTLRLKCWQRLSNEVGDFFTGYHYTAQMAFDALGARGLTHMCCGHQHQHICCQKTPGEIIQKNLKFRRLEARQENHDSCIEYAQVSLDVPSLLRIGGCHGPEPEFAYTDFSTFSFIRIRKN